MVSPGAQRLISSDQPLDTDWATVIQSQPARPQTLGTDIFSPSNPPQYSSRCSGVQKWWKHYILRVFLVTCLQVFLLEWAITVFSQKISLSLSLSCTHQQIRFYLEGINRVVHVVLCFQGFYGVSATPLLFQKQINETLWYQLNWQLLKQTHT